MDVFFVIALILILVYLIIKHIDDSLPNHFTLKEKIEHYFETDTNRRRKRKKVLEKLKSRLQESIDTGGSEEFFQCWPFVLTTYSVPGGIYFQWIADNDASKFIRLIGWRESNGFSPNSYIETEQSIRIVDTNSHSGNTIDKLTEPGEYYYTFYVKEKDHKSEPMRFKKFVINTPENKEYSPNKKTSIESETKKKLTQKYKSMFAIERWRDQMIEKINSSNYSKNEKKERIEAVKEVAHQMRLIEK
jgi:hypothetical protein